MKEVHLPNHHEGFLRVSGIIPELKLGKPSENLSILLHHFEIQKKEGVKILVTPELALTGYTCEDWFHSEQLLEETELAMEQLVAHTHGSDLVLVVGAPYRLPDSRLLNAAWVIQNGKVRGVVPKTFLPNTGEFYERRWFVSSRRVSESVNHESLGEFQVSAKQIFSLGKHQFGIEICQDLWSPTQPSNALALSGAHLILNLSASNELAGKALFRNKLIEVQSQRLLCGYFYVSSGVLESSKDTVFGGHTLAYELGEKLGELAPFQTETRTLCIDFDLDSIKNARTKEICFLEAVDAEPTEKMIFNRLDFFPRPAFHSHQLHHLTSHASTHPSLLRKVSSKPFIDEISDPSLAIEIQAQGLLRRLESAKSKSMILGLSGGLDSTLALRVCTRVRKLNSNIKIIGVTLPGPGTSEKTLTLAKKLFSLVAVDLSLEIKIQAALDQHLSDLGKLASDRSVVYENAQARERTQILFDLANEHQGMVIGTGDLSELALGWCTYNADHMSHYSVNCGIPKTVVKYLVQDWKLQNEIKGNVLLAEALQQILDLPFSPELLPPASDGSISQETEKLIGSYELHDFFLYHFLKHGASMEKISLLAHHAFQDQEVLKTKIDETLKTFYTRFFSQQFKRTTVPPGPKVHSVSLSPRSDFRFPDEMG